MEHSPSSLHILNREGFGPGCTWVARIGEPEADTGMDFAVLRLARGEAWHGDDRLEEALLLLSGRVTFSVAGRQVPAARTSLFDEDPTALHHAAGELVSLRAEGDAELALFRVKNPRHFPAVLFDRGNMLESEHRDKGKLDDTSYRIVRTVFDARNRPDANLVLGEVVSFPGRWSSYPPHHHPQPEIYHYRFSRPQGFGFAGLGERVVQVRQYDTVKILDGLDHPQVAAPGYGMYYIFAIRHLPGNPYGVPEFAAPHRWLREA